MSATAWETERSWNGVEYESHSTFKALDRLNQHLQSPRHEQKIHRCSKPDSHLEFVALSALCQHVERGSCSVRMFKKVQDATESLTRGFKAISWLIGANDLVIGFSTDITCAENHEHKSLVTSHEHNML
jgi:hypothetical protein